MRIPPPIPTRFDRLATPFGVGTTAFVYAVGMALAIQWVILPWVFPAWHAGNGLLVGTDATYYHKAALFFSQQIETFGWEQWQWLPGASDVCYTDCRIPSVLGALYYLVGPWPVLLVPFNALVHGLSCALLFVLFRRFASPKWALLAVLPFALLPTSLLWISQIHKDGATFLGLLLFLVGLVRIFDTSKQNFFKTGALVLLGPLVLFSVKPYLNQLALMGLFIGLVVFALSRPWRQLGGFQAGLRGIGVLLVALYLVPLGRSGLPKPPQMAKTPSTSVREAGVETAPWTASGLPRLIEQRLWHLSQLRDRYRLLKPARSDVDSQIAFHQAGDFIYYFPRAMQVAFLSPFPNTWFRSGTTAATTGFRKLVAFEMLVIYALLPFVLLALWRFRNRTDFWFLFFVCVTLTLLYGYVVVNTGTLHRLRYLFITLLLGLGVLATERTLSQE